MLLILSLLCLVEMAHADTTVKRLAPGVTLTQEIDQKTPLMINVVSVDLDAPGVRIGVGIGQDKVNAPDATQGREDVTRLARRWGAVAAINADYFPYTGDPLGVGIRDGELFSEPFPGIHGSGPRVTLGVTPDNRVLFDKLGFLGDLQAADGARAYVSGIDRSTSPGEIIVYSPIYGQTTSNKPGGVEAVVTGVNLPIRANKLVTGHVDRVEKVQGDTETIPAGGLVISGGPGNGADFLARHLHPGDPVSFVLAVAPVGQTQGALQIASLPRTAGDLPSRSGAGLDRSAYLWAMVPSAVGGGPRLLTDGQVTVDWADEGFDAGFAESLNPRTAVGTTRDGRHLLLVTVDGRQAFSKGVSLAGMALILKRYGAWNAINLDGGGSTTLAADGLTVSNPGGDGSERPVADMLLVYSDRAFQADAPALPAVTADAEAGQEDTEVKADVPAARIVLPPTPIRVGTAVPLRLQDGSHLLSGSAPGILWQGPAAGRLGFVNQKGYLITVAPGTGSVSALYEGHLLTAPITVIGKTAPISVYALSCRLVPDPNGLHDRSQLIIRVTDQNGKPLAFAPVQVEATLGTTDQASVQTDRDGTATVGITWSADTGGSVHITSSTALRAMTPILLKRL